SPGWPSSPPARRAPPADAGSARPSSLPAGDGGQAADELVDVGVAVVEAEADAETVVAVVGDHSGGVEGGVDGGGVGKPEGQEVAAVAGFRARQQLGVRAGGEEAG